MSDKNDKKKTERRDFLFTATAAAGAVGVGAAIWPVVDQMNPDASVKALAAQRLILALFNRDNLLQCFGEENQFLLKEEQIKKFRKLEK